MTLHPTVRGVGLFLLGSVLGTLGLSLYSNGIQGLVDLSVATGTREETANACTPNLRDEHEIFFVSCGGLF